MPAGFAITKHLAAPLADSGGIAAIRQNGGDLNEVVQERMMTRVKIEEKRQSYAGGRLPVPVRLSEARSALGKDGEADGR
jgi:hypothetical protein